MPVSSPTSNEVPGHTTIPVIEPNQTAAIELARKALDWFLDISPYFKFIANLIIQKAAYFEEVKNLYANFVEMGLSKEILHTVMTWERILSAADKIDLILTNFKMLRENRIPVDRSSSFFAEFLSKVISCDTTRLKDLSQLFCELQISFPEEPFATLRLYEQLFMQGSSIEEIKRVFAILEQSGIDFRNIPQRVLGVLHNAKSLLDVKEVLDYFKSTCSDLNNDNDLTYRILVGYKGPSKGFFEFINDLERLNVEKQLVKLFIHAFLLTRCDSEFMVKIRKLRDWNITTESFYRTLFYYSSDFSDRIVCLLDTFVFLRGEGIDVSGNDKLCQTLLSAMDHPGKMDAGSLHTSLKKLFHYLDLIKSNYKNNLLILKDYLELISSMPKWSDAILIMTEMGFNPEHDHDVYDTLFRSGRDVTQVVNKWRLLYLAGAKDVNLFRAVAKQIDFLKHFDAILVLLQEQGLTYQQHPEIYTKELFIDNAEQVLYFVAQLKQAGYRPDHHSEVYVFFAQGLCLALIDYFTLADTLKQLSDFAENNRLFERGDDGFEQQKGVIDFILSIDNRLKEQLACSPMYLSTGTTIVRSICEVIVEVGFDAIEMYYSDDSYYFHDKTRNQKLNLSVMIKNANLSQLCFDQQLMDAMEQLLSPICCSWSLNDDDDQLIKKLHSAEIAALNMYVTTAYINMNKLFRGEPQVPRSDSSNNYVVDEQNATKEIAVFFMLGCLMHNAVNRVIHLQTVPEGLSVGMLRDGTLLDRKEDISPEIIAQRISNPRTYTALTSFSFFKNGTDGIGEHKNIHTKLDNGGAYPCLNDTEGEVIFAQGQTVIERQGGADCLVATLVNSPSVERGFTYWSDLALKAAWDLHSQPYALYVQSFIVHAIEYFARHAADAEFREFCRNCSDDLVEQLRIAAAFSVSGREAECHVYRNPEAYLNNREECAYHFVDFALKIPLSQQYPEAKADPLIILFIIHDIVRGISNPSFEKELDEFQHAGNMSAEHVTLRKYLHRIHNFAYQINLVHWCTPREYKQKMAYFLPLVEQSAEQVADLNERIRYAIQLKKASDDKEISASFIKTGDSLAHVFNAFEMVHRPSTTLPFQWDAFKRKSDGKDSAAKRQMHTREGPFCY